MGDTIEIREIRPPLALLQCNSHIEQWHDQFRDPDPVQYLSQPGCPARLCRIIIIIAVFLMQTIVSLGGCINTLAVCEV